MRKAVMILGIGATVSVVVLGCAKCGCHVISQMASVIGVLVDGICGVVPGMVDSILESED